MDQKTVYVIILNLNHLDDLKETISSFKCQDYPELHLVVVDNNSTDDSVDWLNINHPEIVVIVNKSNLGWAGGNNVGIKYAIEQNADYLLLANNDLFFDDDTIVSELINTAEKHNKIIIGPKQNYYYHPDKIYTCGWNVLRNSKIEFNSIRANFELVKFPSGMNIVDYVPGSFILFNSKLIDDIGLIDEDFYLYSEDADFSLKAWQNGYFSVVDNRFTILHKVSATAGKKSKIKSYYKTRNVWLLLRKNYMISNNVSFFKRKVIFSFVKNIIKNIINFNFILLKANIIGFYHGAVIKKYGKYY